MSRAVAPFVGWRARQWVTAAVAAIAYVLVVAVPTDLIDTPFFSRQVPPTWWSWPALITSSVLGGLLTATYVNVVAADRSAVGDARRGAIGGMLTFFAVGCPVCNKLVLLAVGTAGAISWFQPVQPVLQVVAIALLVWALRRRLANSVSCAVPADT